MVKEMDVLKEIEQIEQNKTRKLNTLKPFILIRHLRIYKLLAGFFLITGFQKLPRQLVMFLVKYDVSEAGLPVFCHKSVCPI